MAVITKEQIIKKLKVLRDNPEHFHCEISFLLDNDLERGELSLYEEVQKAIEDLIKNVEKEENLEPGTTVSGQSFKFVVELNTSTYFFSVALYYKLWVHNNISKFDWRMLK